MLKRNVKDRIEFGKFERKFIFYGNYKIVYFVEILNYFIYVFQRIFLSIFFLNYQGNQLQYYVSIYIIFYKKVFIYIYYY